MSVFQAVFGRLYGNNKGKKVSGIRYYYDISFANVTDDNIKWPLPLDVIPNQMGIPLCAVHSIEWIKTNDGQLKELTIHFIPEGLPV